MSELFRIGEPLSGRKVIAELAGYVTFGVLHIDTFIVEKAEKNGNDPHLYMKAADLIFTSIEGWSVKLWDSKGADRHLRGKEAYDKLFERVHACMFCPKDEQHIPKTFVRTLKKIVHHKPFKFKISEVAAFITKGKSRCIEELEEHRMEDLIRVTEHAFGRANARHMLKGIRRKGRAG